MKKCQLFSPYLNFFIFKIKSLLPWSSPLIVYAIWTSYFLFLMTWVAIEFIQFTFFLSSCFNWMHFLFVFCQSSCKCSHSNFSDFICRCYCFHSVSELSCTPKRFCLNEHFGLVRLMSIQLNINVKIATNNLSD